MATTKEKTRGSSTPPLRETIGGKSERWIERVVVHGEGDLFGQPFRLRPDQRQFLWAWMELDVDGGWWYEEGYYEAPSGVGKTMELAALALEAFAGPSSMQTTATPNVVVQANSRDQASQKKGDDVAEGIFGRIAQIVEHDNCPLKGLVKVWEDRITFADGRPGRIRLIPAKGSTTDGGLPTLYIGDEVQDWTGQARDAYVRNSKGTTKTAMSRTLCASTPGAYAGMGSVGWDLHTYGESGEDERFLYRKIAAPADTSVTDETQLRPALEACNPGISKRRLDQLMRRVKKIPASDFKRFHLGLWVEADAESWLHDHPGAWERCESKLDIPDGHPVGVGVDVGLNRDSMCVAIAARVGDKVVVRATIWEPDRDRAVDIRLARLHISALPYGIIHVAYDPRYFAESSTELEDEGVPIIEIPQTVERLAPADAHLYGLILAESITHDGDPKLAQHINAAVKRPTERGWYLSKNRTKRHMDGARAVSLAVAALDLWQPEGVGVPIVAWV